MNEKTGEKTLYEVLDENNVIGILRPLLQQHGYKIRESDGRLVAEMSQAHDTPWIHVRPAFRSDGTAFDCYRWHKIAFEFVSRRITEPFVPSHCHECWKVVVRPATLQQLFEVEKMQRELNRPSKCGLEVRGEYGQESPVIVSGLYGGYWYNESKEEGLVCYKLVKEAMENNEILKPILENVDENGLTTKLLLKRGCTEFELLCGDSEKWEVTPAQKQIEALISYYVVPDDVVRFQHNNVSIDVKQRWIKYAYKHADPTYWLYHDQPLNPPYKTYHGELDAGDETKNEDLGG